MLRYAAIFFVIALIAAVFGFGGIAVGAAEIAKILFFVFLVFRENSFTSAIIEVASEQRVVSTGPYSVVRHPMYSGAMLLLVFTPLALGSWVGLPFAIPVILVIVARLLSEEKFLAGNLRGYAEYRRNVRWRLLPGIW